MEIAPAMLAAQDGVGEAAPSASTLTSESVSVGNKNSSTNTYDDDDDEEEDVCRICRNPGDADNPLRYPCACSGSIKFVHQDCLLQWLNHSNARQCETRWRDG
ncbi:Zinc finger, RING-CH-type [Cynara cardunculus var. scolymus]|uniref:RING-type E3 ubiquitin transferase n=1 Tax=Cynara cardunculus var. scolymus TaxID=59895 RepID=A0A103Y3R5_CYNCS|nr:Zinc finger, RING-CH-type [Cynara cardunculus var. scolymus]